MRSILSSATLAQVASHPAAAPAKLAVERRNTSNRMSGSDYHRRGIEIPMRDGVGQHRRAGRARGREQHKGRHSGHVLRMWRQATILHRRESLRPTARLVHGCPGLLPCGNKLTVPASPARAWTSMHRRRPTPPNIRPMRPSRYRSCRDRSSRPATRAISDHSG